MYMYIITIISLSNLTDFIKRKNKFFTRKSGNLYKFSTNKKNLKIVYIPRGKNSDIINIPQLCTVRAHFRLIAKTTHEILTYTNCKHAKRIVFLHTSEFSIPLLLKWNLAQRSIGVMAKSHV